MKEVMKRAVLAVIAIALLLTGWLAVNRYLNTRNAAAGLETEAAQRDDLRIFVEAPGVVRSDQSALLRWKTSGFVEQVNVSLGDQVNSGEVLASLESTTLPQNIILAQADLVNAQRDLDNLLNSQVKSAQAQQAVEQARQALEDARDPEQVRARAQTALAEALKARDDAERDYEILTKPPSQDVIDQSHANLLLAEKQLNDLQKQIERVRRRATKPEDKLMFFESREMYERILEALELREVQVRRSYEDSLDRYNRLIEPPNPNDVAVAEAELSKAEAQLKQSQLDWERDQDGTSPAELAVLEAQLSDAQREWERWKDGTDEAEIAAVKARIAAAQAALDSVHIQAPFEGTITGVFTHPGDQVGTSEQGFRLDDFSRILVDAAVTEVDINKVKTGQEVVLTLDAVPGREYHGRVVEVPEVAEVVQGVANFNIVIEVTDSDQSLRPQMTAKANLVVEQLQDALLVPNQALRLLEGERVVYILREGEMLPIPLKLGSGSTTYTQVISGNLKEGDQIVLNPPSNIQVSMNSIQTQP